MPIPTSASASRGRSVRRAPPSTIMVADPGHGDDREDALCPSKADDGRSRSGRYFSSWPRTCHPRHHPIRMWIEVVVFTGFALVLGGVVWWTWGERQRAERRARMNADLAELGRCQGMAAADVSHWFELIITELERMRAAAGPAAGAQFDRVTNAARGAADFVPYLRGPGSSVRARHTSAEGLVRMTVMMMRNSGVPVAFKVDGDLEYRGEDADALRVLLNLLGHAVYESAQHDGTGVLVELEEGMLRVINHISTDANLDDTIHEASVRDEAMGFGPSIARGCSAKVGWQLAHEVRDSDVTFSVWPLAAVALDS